MIPDLAPAVLSRNEPVQPTTAQRLQKQVDTSVGGHRTSSSIISAVVGGVSTRGGCHFSGVNFYK